MPFEINLLALNNRGIFPGPNESRENFLERADSSVNIPKQLSPSKAFELTKELFDADPDWVEVKMDAKGLLPWEGAATWIEENEKGQRISAIQLKPSLPAWLYLPEEMLAHELVHAMRMGFEDNRFEEILAYQTSKNKLRRYFGPLFARPAEVKGFIFLSLVTWLGFWAELAFELELGGRFFVWAPLFAIGLGIFRLMRSQRTFSAALRNLKKAITKPGKSLAVALRLSDSEILQFAISSPNEIIAFAQKKKETDLRWNQLFAAYF
jgi:hypothetical protein